MTLWETRDFPVLHALAKTTAEDAHGGYLWLGQDVGREKLSVDLSDGEIELSILALCDADYVDAKHGATAGGESGSFTKLAVTGHGMQALGEWPYFTDLSPATIAALLERFADEASTEEESDNAHRAAKYVRGLPEGVLRKVLTTVMVESAKASLRFVGS